MSNVLEHGSVVSATATHATAAAAALPAVSGKRYFAVNVSASSDKSGAIVLVKDGTSVVHQLQVNAGNVSIPFPYGLPGTSGNAMSVEIDGTSACKANIVAVSV